MPTLSDLRMIKEDKLIARALLLAGVPKRWVMNYYIIESMRAALRARIHGHNVGAVIKSAIRFMDKRTKDKVLVCYMRLKTNKPLFARLLMEMQRGYDTNS